MFVSTRIPSPLMSLPWPVVAVACLYAAGWGLDFALGSHQRYAERAPVLARACLALWQCTGILCQIPLPGCIHLSALVHHLQHELSSCCRCSRLKELEKGMHNPQSIPDALLRRSSWHRTCPHPACFPVVKMMTSAEVRMRQSYTMQALYMHIACHCRLL